MDVWSLTSLSSLMILNGRWTIVVGLGCVLLLRWCAERVNLIKGTINRVSDRLIVLIVARIGECFI